MPPDDLDRPTKAPTVHAPVAGVGGARGDAGGEVRGDARGDAPPHPAAAPVRWTRESVFFLSAAGYGAVLLPLSVLTMTGQIEGPPALAGPPAHARELLLGYALAVVAGYQLAPMHGPRLWLTWLLWAAGRATWMAGLGSASAICSAAFALALAAASVPRLVRSAKRWSNRALPLALTALCLAAGWLGWAVRPGGAAEARPAALTTLLTLALLMLFMGGRILTPAIVGSRTRQGQEAGARLQPRLEAASLVGAMLAIAAALGTAPPARGLVALGCLVAGAAAAVRWLRWRVWTCRRRPDLWCLGAGYAWLALGLLDLGASLMQPEWPSRAVHLLTVGALGTLTFTVMSWTVLLKARADPAGSRVLVLGTLLMGLATLARALSTWPGPWQIGLLLLGAAAWSAALLMLAVQVPWSLRVRRRQVAARG